MNISDVLTPGEYGGTPGYITIKPEDSPLPPSTVPGDAWVHFLNQAYRDLAKLVVSTGNTQKLDEFITTLYQYKGQQLPQVELEKLTYLLQDATGINLQAYIGNPAGLVQFYLNKVKPVTSPDYSKFIGIGLIIAAIVLMFFLVFKT